MSEVEALAEQARGAAPDQYTGGIHEGVPEEEYHSWDLPSQSTLKWLRSGLTPAHVRHDMTAPETRNEALDEGSAFHARVLQPDTFEQKVVRGLDLPRRKNADKAEHEAFEEQHKGKLILKPDTYDRVVSLADKAMYHPAVQWLLGDGGGVAEVSLIAEFVTPTGSAKAKARLDWLSHQEQAIVDFKTTRLRGEAAIVREIFNRGYHMQGGFYLRMSQALGIDVKDFILVVVEKEPPNEVAVWNLDPLALDIGWAELEPYLNLMARCYAEDYWPGYSKEIEDLALPMWMARQGSDSIT